MRRRRVEQLDCSYLLNRIRGLEVEIIKLKAANLLGDRYASSAYG